MEQPVCAPGDTNVGTSNASMVDRTEKSGYDHLPKELNEMKIRDEKSNNRNGKDMEPTIVNVDGTETGQVITTAIGGRLVVMGSQSRSLVVSSLSFVKG
ncbi:hypothetical protein QN277_023650 [Acacia crassicarpa]|uniref:Uncharacterized protein n=1 Tax=Acacia crassicarpa TaxID=499986 RepID=A0AAE1JEX6_9FABA|nr:hypothetical protein QN277_023650 [Acacia crassicarpa]